jgi:hypothetical protein
MRRHRSLREGGREGGKGRRGEESQKGLGKNFNAD